MTSLKEGCNYTAAGIMMCACDLFAYVRYGKEHHGATFVTDYMGRIDSRYSEIGKTLYESLRHGIVHMYETKKVVIGNKTIDFVISWRDRKHFSVDPSKLEINLNVPKMLEELKEAFETYVQELKNNGQRRDVFRGKMRERATTNAKDKKEEKALLNFFLL